MKLRLTKEITQAGATQWIVKDKETGLTRASTRTRDEARKFVENHKAELKATQS